jgi:hypothetical protein
MNKAATAQFDITNRNPYSDTSWLTVAEEDLIRMDANRLDLRNIVLTCGF